MTNTFFEENTYYPIEKLIEGLKQSGFTHFTVLNDAIYPVKIPVKSGDPVEPAPSALPLVCDFISQGRLQVGDVVIDNLGNVEIVTNIVTDDPDDKYPIHTNEETYSLNGWEAKHRSFNKDFIHIIKITRDGNVVAEGNRYKDTP
jgi:hypothetical protein